MSYIVKVYIIINNEGFFCEFVTLFLKILAAVSIFQSLYVCFVSSFNLSDFDLSDFDLSDFDLLYLDLSGFELSKATKQNNYVTRL